MSASRAEVARPWAGRAAAVRLVETILAAVLVSAASFVLLGMTEGDAAVAAVQARGGQVTPEAVAAERARLGLDLEPLARYGHTVVRALHGDFGVSVRSGLPVADELTARLRPTLVLAGAGSLVTIAVGLALGLADAFTRSRLLCAVLRAVSLVLVSVPGFALAFLFVAQFSLAFGWLPTQGMAGWRALVLPALVLGLPAGAALGRVLAARLRAVATEPYLVTARAHGHSRSACLLRWALPNAAVTALVVGGNVLAAVASGTVVVEDVFGWPGLGSYLIAALRYRDWYPLQASVLVFAVLIVLVRGLTLATAAGIDPRARSAR